MNDQAIGTMSQIATERPQTEAEPSQAASDKTNNLTHEWQEELLANFSPLYVGMQHAKSEDVTDFEEVINKLDISKPNRKRLWFVLYELLQNTLNNQLKGYEKESKFLMYESNGKLKIEISNYVKDEIQAEKVKNLLKKVDAESLAELKGESKRALTTEWFSQGWWAGRWFYEIAEKIRKIDPEAENIFSCEKEATDIDGIFNVIISIEFSFKRNGWKFRLAA